MIFFLYSSRLLVSFIILASKYSLSTISLANYNFLVIKSPAAIVPKSNKVKRLILQRLKDDMYSKASLNSVYSAVKSVQRE
jgi:hypothetical protein